MSSHTHPAAPSVWTKIAAALCLVLCLQLVVLQSWHTHAAPAVVAAQSVHAVAAQANPADDADAACPACAAMHLAPLVAASVDQAPGSLAVTTARALAQPWREFQLAFHLYSRPPPRS